MEKAEFPRVSGEVTSSAEATAGDVAAARCPREARLEIDARAAKWWVAYSGTVVSSR
jgi:hypothetical protein